MNRHTSLRAPHAMVGSATSAANFTGPHCPLTQPGGKQPQHAPTWEELLGQR
jgi:hypothetical protein